MKKEFFNATWTLIGITLGAGILGLPYIISKAGFLTGLIVMLIVGLIMLLTTLYYGEIILRTKGKHQITGLAEKYLGSKSKHFIFIINTLSIYGALAAYTIGIGQALTALLGFSPKILSIISFIILSILIYFNIKIIEKFESIFTPLKIIIAIIISILMFKFINLNNLLVFNVKNILIPYGISIFAFTGISAIPEMSEELRNKKYLLYSIITGMVITFIIYILFILSLVGSLNSINEVATVSLSQFGPGIKLLANLFAVFAMVTGFIVLGFALKESLILDYKVKNRKSWLIVIIVPFLILISGYIGFTKILELIGAIAIGILLLSILIMHSKAQKLGDRKPEYELKDSKFLKIFLAIIIIIGIIFSVIT